jgi:hypothetical protein
MPYLGIASCLLLMAQQTGYVWTLAGLFTVVGVGLYGLAQMGVKSHPLAAPADAP